MDFERVVFLGMKQTEELWNIVKLFVFLKLDHTGFMFKFSPQSIGKGAEFKNITVNENSSID